VFFGTAAILFWGVFFAFFEQEPILFWVLVLELGADSFFRCFYEQEPIQWAARLGNKILIMVPVSY
jgi:hypothetical protein